MIKLRFFIKSAVLFFHNYLERDYNLTFLRNEIGGILASHWYPLRFSEFGDAFALCQRAPD